MSFDLYALDLDEVPDEEALLEGLEDDTGWDAELTEPLAALVAELEQRFPGLDDDPDGSPWATWPLTQSVLHGRGCAFNISWSAVDQVLPVVAAASRAHGVSLYDPQADTITPPDGAPPAAPVSAPAPDPDPGSTRFWRRRSR